MIAFHQLSAASSNLLEFALKQTAGLQLMAGAHGFLMHLCKNKPLYIVQAEVVCKTTAYKAKNISAD